MNVSRETTERLTLYCALMSKWTARINLVASSTIDSLYERHVADCLQLVPLIPPSARSAVDLGSGAGLPGLVVAVALMDLGRPVRMTLIESDRRKCAFLADAARQLAVQVDIRAQRILEVPRLAADVVMARALAPLKDLIAYQSHHGSPEGTGLYMKGARYHEEIAVARNGPQRFSVTPHPSQTAGSALLAVSLHD
jgi:16S rRNA (guanine527-N7)-methyltransferase